MFTFPTEVALEVTISGAWSPGAAAVWKGAASASEPIFALLLLRSGLRTAWAKSRHLSSQLDVQFILHFLSTVGTEAQLIYLLGSGSLYKNHSVLPSSSYRPEILAPRTVTTGQLFEFAHVAGDPPAAASAVLFSRRDVTVMRSEIWRLHQRLLERLAPPWRDILARGRTGAFEG